MSTHSVRCSNYSPPLMFQQWGKPVHWSVDVSDHWNRLFLGDELDEIDKPHGHRSPHDATHLNCFFWGHVKDRVYETSVPDLLTLRRWKVAVIQTVDVPMLQHVWMELEYCLDILIATKGAHVEVE